MIPGADPAIISALATIAQATVVGTFLVLLTFGVYRHKREVEREEKATAEANIREVAAHGRTDAAIALLRENTDALRSLREVVQAVLNAEQTRRS